MKYSFLHDCLDGVHPQLINYIVQNDQTQQNFSEDAAERIRKAFNVPAADIHFLPTSTMANIIGLTAMLKPYEGVIAATTGHINTYEVGAIEAAGHKVIGVDAADGKLTPTKIAEGLARCDDRYAVVPRVVYLSQLTELGTTYTKIELEQIIEYAKSKDLYVFVDGARLATALANKACEMTLQEFGNLGLDMFFVGGTKNGGMYGEALVILNDSFKPNIYRLIKQRGGSMAKPRFMEQQFARFFAEDNLWLEIAAQTNARSTRLYDGLRALNIHFDEPAGASILFPVLPNDVIEKLAPDYGFHTWEKVDATHTKLRLVCSWSTKDEDIDMFLTDIKKALN